MRFITWAFLGLLGFSEVQGATSGTQSESTRLMRSYDWAGLNGAEESIYLAGAMESFFFRLYSVVDGNSINQVRGYNELASCAQTQQTSIQRSFNNSLALGRDLEKSFPDILWNETVPLVCERERQAAVGHLKKTVRFVSHLDWDRFSRKQKNLYLRGYLEAQLHLLSREPESKEKSQNLGLYKQITTEQGQNKIVELLDRNGLEPGLPIPWSIARASGSIVKRGPGYATTPTKQEWADRVSKDLVGAWFSWVDLEAINSVCLNKWNQSDIRGFKESIRTELLGRHKCVAEKISNHLLPKFLTELRIPRGEIEKMRAQLSSTLIQDKTLMAEKHFSSLTASAQLQLCADNWELLTSPAKSPYFQVHQIQYGLKHVTNTIDAANLAKSLVTDCKIPSP